MQIVFVIAAELFCKMRNDSVKKIAYASMFVAISVVFCIVAGVFSTMSLAITALSGLIASIALLLCGFKYSMLVYIATSLLALLLVPNKEAAVYYILLFGHYPMTKLLIERIGKKVLAWFVKILFANALYMVEIFVAAYFLGIYEVVGTMLFLMTILLFNVVFVLYDICMTRVMIAFIVKHSQNRRFR